MSMPLRRRWVSVGQSKTELLFRTREALETAYSISETGEPFISHQVALGILTREQVHVLLHDSTWYDEDSCNVIYPHMGIILCILISIHFDQWDSFGNDFLLPGSSPLQPKFSDQDLPLQDVSMLPSPIQDSFKRQQYSFLPVPIEKDTHKDIDHCQRFPIIKVEAISNMDALSSVDKVYVEKGHVQFGPRTYCEAIIVMVRKRVKAKTGKDQRSFSTVRYHLEQFKRIPDHENIMRTFASFVCGPEFINFSEWGEGGSLSQFLNHPDQIYNDYALQSLRFSPHHLFTEVHRLAEALDFVHHHMTDSKGIDYRCAHLDLKPDNILVCLPNAPSDAPVGRWKIAAFDLANIDSSFGRCDLSSTSSATLLDGLAPETLLDKASSLLQCEAGPFQPPEAEDASTAKVSTRRDVWSLGCVLLMVIAFTVGGSEEVAHQQNCRGETPNNHFFVRLCQSPEGNSSCEYGQAITNAEVKPGLVTWLQDRAPSLVTQQHSQWLSLCSSLVLKLLEVDLTKRPTMDEAVKGLANVLEFTNYAARERIWNVDQPKSLPVPVLTPRPDDDHDFHSPFSAASASSSSGYSVSNRQDPSLRYVKLQTVPGCEGAGLSPTGGLLAFWSRQQALIYDLSAVHDDDESWQTLRPRFSRRLGPEILPTCQIHALEGCRIHKILMNGPHLAVLKTSKSSEAAQPDLSKIQFYARDSTVEDRTLAFLKRTFVPIAPGPVRFKLSSDGRLLVQSSRSMQLVTPEGSWDVCVGGDADLIDFDFTGDGKAFCLWLRERDCYSWHIRSISGTPLVKITGPKISRPVVPRSRGEAFLVPFNTHSRFIACDEYGSAFMACADYTGEKVKRLGRLGGVTAAQILPEDDALLVVRAPSDRDPKRQTLERVSWYSWTRGERENEYVSLEIDNWGKAPETIDRSNSSAICVRASNSSEGGRLSLLTVQSSGILSSKFLHQ